MEHSILQNMVLNSGIKCLFCLLGMSFNTCITRNRNIVSRDLAKRGARGAAAPTLLKKNLYKLVIVIDFMDHITDSVVPHFDDVH